MSGYRTQHQPLSQPRCTNACQGVERTGPPTGFKPMTRCFHHDAKKPSKPPVPFAQIVSRRNFGTSKLSNVHPKRCRLGGDRKSVPRRNRLFPGKMIGYPADMKRSLSREQSSALILSIDIGTSSLRTALFDARGGRFLRTTAQEAYSLRVTPDGGAELSPETLRQTFFHCLSQTLRSYRADRTLRLRPIVAAGTSCFWHSLLGADESGHALTPIYTWADSRSREDAARLRAELSERAIHARTGCMLRSSYWPAKLLWLRGTRTKVFTRVAH